MAETNRIYFNCEVCGKEKWDTVSKYNSRNHHFCSRECFNVWMKRNRISVKCAVCGKSKDVTPLEIENNESGLWFCSNKHRLEYHDLKSEINVTELICEFCSKKFTIRNCILSNKNGKRRFCCKQCEKNWYKQNSRIEFNCDFCGILTNTIKSKYESKTNHFCSKECAVNYVKNNRIEVKCSNCDKTKFVAKYEFDSKKYHFCDRRCQGEWKSKNNTQEKHWAFKGGSDQVWYDDVSDKLKNYEEIRRLPNDLSILQVRCTYCNQWVTPTRHEVLRRIAWIEGRGRQEGRFYCHNIDCKKLCPIYGQNKYPKGYKEATSREVQPELRKLVFERDNWQCQICGDVNSLHCHHIEGININPIESADIDLCITVCKEHHRLIHKQKGCSFNDLKCNRSLDLPHTAQ